MKTIYIVVERGYDYNDEYYYPVDGVTVKQSFFNQKDAVEACKQTNIDMLNNYCADIFDEDYSSLDENKIARMYGCTINEFLDKWENNLLNTEDVLSCIKPGCRPSYIIQQTVQE